MSHQYTFKSATSGVVASVEAKRSANQDSNGLRSRDLRLAGLSQKISNSPRLVQQRRALKSSAGSGHSSASSAQIAPIQRVMADGTFHQDLDPGQGFVTISVDNRNMGHTYIIGETEDGAWMYHFRANNDYGNLPKVVSWRGTFEQIQQQTVNGQVQGHTPQNFVANRPMLHAELEIGQQRVDQIHGRCQELVGAGEMPFSLLAGGSPLGDNCVSKVYDILREAGVTFSWSTYIYSFFSPRLALSWGSGLQEAHPHHE